MIRLFQYDNPSLYKDFPDFLFTDMEYTINEENETVVIDEIEYYLPGDSPIAEDVLSRRNNWQFIQGNSIETIYYEGVELGNPSGSINNIKYMNYKNSKDIIEFGIEFQWDELNRIKTQKTI